MDVGHFTPIASLVGGMLIGLAAALLWILNGRIAGISGIVGELFGRRARRGALAAGVRRRPRRRRRARRAVHPAALAAPRASTTLLVASGLLVGFGTRLANGCTSGHGVCGVSRLSPRSLAATAIFMAVGIATVLVTRHLVGLR